MTPLVSNDSNCNEHPYCTMKYQFSASSSDRQAWQSIPGVIQPITLTDSSLSVQLLMSVLIVFEQSMVFLKAAVQNIYNV